MTVNQLYSIIHEVAFGTKSVIYITTETFKDRKQLGPMLTDLLEEQGISRLGGNPQEWAIQYENERKYLRFSTGYVELSNAEKNYSAVIDL